MSDSSTNKIDSSGKIPIFISQAFHEAKAVALLDQNDSAALARTKEHFKEQIADWGKDIAKDLFQDALHDFGIGKGATAGEGAAASGFGRLAGPTLVAAKAVVDIAKIYGEQANQANAAAGLPEQSFLKMLAIGYHLFEPPPILGVIDFTKAGRDISHDQAALAEYARTRNPTPLDRAQNHMIKPEQDYEKRLAAYNQHVETTGKIEQAIARVDAEYSRFWLFRNWFAEGAAAQDAYKAAFGWNFPDKDADLDARMKEVRSEVDRQRVVNQREYQAFHKSSAAFIKEGQDQFVQESLDDDAVDLRRKRTAHQEDIPGERALEQMREQNIIPDSPAGKDILAEERGRYYEQASASPPSALNGSQSSPDICPCEDILNQQLDEQTKIARALDEISRQGLHFVTGVGMEGL